MRHEMKNTQTRIVRLMSGAGPRSARRVMERLYPNTQQPERKLQTVLRHFRELERSGYVLPLGPLWMLTHAGEAVVGAPNRAAMLKLAK